MRSIAEIVFDSIFGACFVLLMIVAFVGQAIVDFLDHYFFITLFIILLLRAGKKFLSYALSNEGRMKINESIIRPLRRGRLLEQWYWFSQTARHKKLQRK